MSVSIRHHYHGGNVYINTKKVILGHAVTGVTIPALRCNGQYRYKPFGGILDDEYGSAKELQVVKLVNLTGFWWNDIAFGDDGIDIPVNHIVKGYYFNDRYYIAIKNDQLIHWYCEPVTTNYHTDNVVDMSSRRQR